MPIEPNKVQVTTVIKRTTLAKLAADATKQTRSVSAQIRYILEQHYPDEEAEKDLDQ